jgi:hypothetical protein
MTPEMVDEAIDAVCNKYLNDESVYIKVVAGIAYRAGMAAGEGRLLESESEKAHLISAMKDCWTEMMRAREVAKNTVPESWVDPHLSDWI